MFINIYLQYFFFLNMISYSILCLAQSSQGSPLNQILIQLQTMRFAS